MTDKEHEYLMQLKGLCDTIQDPFERSIFINACCFFQAYKLEKRDNKNISKEALMCALINDGLLYYKPDGTLPDDRKVRMAARNLLKSGKPLLATSNQKGYYIAESVEEIDAPKMQNYERALKLLAASKGYEKARDFIAGQEKF